MIDRLENEVLRLRSLGNQAGSVRISGDAYLRDVELLLNEYKKAMARVEANDFWKSVFKDIDGDQLENIKLELQDYYFILQEVPKVYSHITDGMLSKPNYYSDGVIAAADERFEHWVKGGIEDGIENAKEEFKHVYGVAEEAKKKLKGT